MDLLTQGLLGAAVAQSAAPSRHTRVAAFVGMAAGLLPDVDVLIRSPSDPLLFLDFHRHFTHALLVVPVIALLAALILWPLLRARLAFARIYAYALLGSALAGALDACTSYGTNLFWPFTDQPVALGIVAIVDPVVTVALVLGVVLGLRSMRRRPSAVALAVVLAYFGFALVQQQGAQSAAEQLAHSRGHAPQRAIVKPTLGNVVLWRSLYTLDGSIHADAIRVSPFAATIIYPGESAPLVDVAALARNDDAMAPSLQRFARFATGLLVRHPDRREMIGDARFAMLPGSLKPLWGIVPAVPTAGYPADFVTERSMSASERARFIDMLLGRALQ